MKEREELQEGKKGDIFKDVERMTKEKNYWNRT